jgi:hypothetical protein
LNYLSHNHLLNLNNYLATSATAMDDVHGRTSVANAGGVRATGGNDFRSKHQQQAVEKAGAFSPAIICRPDSGYGWADQVKLPPLKTAF